MRKPRLGSRWRILAHEGRGKQRRLDLHSHDYDEVPDRVPFSTVFDELVIAGVLHIEQMDERTWWVGIANGDMFMVSVKRDGTVQRGEIYR